MGPSFLVAKVERATKYYSLDKESNIISQARALRRLPMGQLPRKYVVKASKSLASKFNLIAFCVELVRANTGNVFAWHCLTDVLLYLFL